MKSTDKNLKCGFCHRSKPETNVLIAGIDTYICDKCIKQADQVINEQLNNKTSERYSEEKLVTQELDESIRKKPISSRDVEFYYNILKTFSYMASALYIIKFSLHYFFNLKLGTTEDNIISFFWYIILLMTCYLIIKIMPNLIFKLKEGEK